MGTPDPDPARAKSEMEGDYGGLPRTLAEGKFTEAAKACEQMELETDGEEGCQLVWVYTAQIVCYLITGRLNEARFCCRSCQLWRTRRGRGCKRLCPRPTQQFRWRRLCPCWRTAMRRCSSWPQRMRGSWTPINR